MKSNKIPTGNKNDTGIDTSDDKFCIPTILEVDDGKKDTADINALTGKINGL